MMRDALVAAGLAAIVAGPVGVADAAPRPVCNLLGPAVMSDHRGVVPDDAVAITSADVASNARYLTAAIRVKSLADAEPAVVGRDFAFHFSSSAERHFALEVRLWGDDVVRTRLYQTAQPFTENGTGAAALTPLGDGTAVLDARRNEVRVTVPLRVAGLRSTSKPATKLVHLGAQVSRVYGVPYGVAPLPDTSHVSYSWSEVHGGPAVSYTLGTRSCVPVGR